MVESSGLLNRRTSQEVPGVRIPPSPPYSIYFYNLVGPAGMAVACSAKPENGNGSRSCEIRTIGRRFFRATAIAGSFRCDASSRIPGKT